MSDEISPKTLRKERIIMTNEERTAKLAELRAEAEAGAVEWNTANLEHRFADAARAAEKIDTAVKEYTALARMMCFEHCKNADDPMLEAVKLLNFETIAVKDEKSGDDDVVVRSIVERERPIDLSKLDNYCGGIGADKVWLHEAQQMNFLLTAQKCKDLGVDPKTVNDSYAMSAIAREINMGKNPTSNSNLLRTLQRVITSMLGEGYKATSHDVNYLMSIYARKNRKALSVTCADHRRFRGYLAEICHRIVTGASYEVNFKARKESTTTASAKETAKVSKAEPLAKAA